LYHGVTSAKSRGIENYSGKHILEDEFFQHMKYIKKHCVVISIDEAVEFKRKRKGYPPRAVVVSFDDGFRNIFTSAAPILESLRIPAIFYITSGIVNTDIMFWVDMIEDCLNITRKSSIKIRLDKEYSFAIRNNGQKINALQRIKSFCKASRADVKNRVINDLMVSTKVSPSTSHALNYQKISWPELKMLSKNSLFTIGGHSLYHDALSQLGSDRLRCDIPLSLKLLEYNLGKKIFHYSYPEGGPRDYNEKIIQYLKSLGIVCCPSAQVGLNDLNTGLFHLKRIMVGFMGIRFPYWDKNL
jgi:peptidoglycan/xylan/chitin deacetylase (PgdA/CDA1 family)